MLPVSLVCLVDWFAYCFSHAICIFTRQIKWMDGFLMATELQVFVIVRVTVNAVLVQVLLVRLTSTGTHANVNAA